MTPELRLNIRRNAATRAHLAGAKAAALQAQAQQLLKEAAAAKRLYFRELTTADLIGGHPTSFAHLGEEG